MTNTARAVRCLLSLVLTASPLPAGAAEVANSVVKVFATMRYPDPFKPWTKQAPTEVTGSGRRHRRQAHPDQRARGALREPGADPGQCGRRQGLPATVVAVAPGIDLAVLQLDDASSSIRIRR